MTKSLICPLATNNKDKVRALNEVDSFAEYASIDSKTARNIRLASEELLNMLEVVVAIEDGYFWIDKVESGYEINLKAESIIGEKAGEVLLKTSKENVNQAYKGIAGVFKQIADIFTNPNAYYGSASGIEINSGRGNMIGLEYFGTDGEWSFREYKEQIQQEKRIENWDELELTVLEKIADDIKVSIRNKNLEIKVLILN